MRRKLTTLTQILTNLTLFVVASFIYCLQRICYGPLRPIEVEQLYEKGWFAITETCLAMTIFRDEVGAWFLVMFVALMAGKIWGWVGEGRVEILEQQPPANPRLFHIRLSISLAMSILYDAWLLSYAINSVIQQARPNMMVMFLFEFAILTTSSFSTALRYGISLIEAKIVKQQTQEMLESRRAEVRRQRQDMIREREAAAASGEPLSAEATEEPLPSEDDIEEMDIEPPGWETKGHWVLTLDLMTGTQFFCWFGLAFLLADIFFRFRQVGYLLCFLLYPPHLLRLAYPYYARPIPHRTFVSQAPQCVPKVQECDERYEPKIPRCYCGRDSKRGYLHYLPRRDDTLVCHKSSTWCSGSRCPAAATCQKPNNQRAISTKEATMWACSTSGMLEELARKAAGVSHLPPTRRRHQTPRSSSAKTGRRSPTPPSGPASPPTRPARC